MALLAWRILRPGLLPVWSGFILLMGGVGGGIPGALASEEVRLETVYSDNRGNPANGKLAQGGDGWLYGTTPGGGLAGKGTVFRVSPSTGELVTLGCFNGENGANPNPGLARADDGSQDRRAVPGLPP